jgi:ATP synthase protein I
MSAPDPDPDEHDPLVTSARRQGERRRRWRREGEPSTARRLAEIGVLGWVIVTPMLIGVFIGRWLDRTFASGIFWTAPLLIVGVAIGAWSAWKWINAQ